MYLVIDDTFQWYRCASERSTNNEPPPPNLRMLAGVPTTNLLLKFEPAHLGNPERLTPARHKLRTHRDTSKQGKSNSSYAINLCIFGETSIGHTFYKHNNHDIGNAFTCTLAVCTYVLFKEVEAFSAFPLSETTKMLLWFQKCVHRAAKWIS